MIESSADNINILYPDGTGSVFDGTELRLRLEKAVAETGSCDLSIAEDIALAVEFGLRSGQKESGCSDIPASLLENAVAKTLEDAGYSAVAEKFLASSFLSPAAYRISFPEIPPFLSGTLSLDENETSRLSSEVENALKTLGFEKCSPRLVLELAREYRTIAAETAMKKRQAAPDPRPKAVLPPAADRIAALAPGYRSLIERGALKLRESTSLFPSVRVEIRLKELMNGKTAQGALTELSMAPELSFCAETVDALYQESVKNVPGGKLPLVITFSDIFPFVSEYVLPDGMEGSPERCARNIGNYFRTLLSTVPFRVRYGK